MLVLNSNMENGTLTVSLRIEPGEFMDALNEAYAEHTDTYPVPGHASGLAPREEIEKLYGETALFDEALDICVPRLYARYLKENGIRTVGRPQLTEVTWLHGGGAKFTVVCDVYPKVKLGQYKGLTVDAKRENTEEFTAKALTAACMNMTAEVPQGMVTQKLEAMLAKEKMQIGRDAIYNLLSDFTAVIEAAYAEMDIHRSKAQVQAEALDVMLQTVSGDNKAVSPEKFRSLVRELVEHYRIVPRTFDETIDRLVAEHSTKKRAMTPDERIDAAFDAYLGSINQTLGLWRENNTEKARDAAMFDLLLGAVAEAEGLVVSGDEYMRAMRQLSDETGVELDEVMAQVDGQLVREQMLRDKARELIVSSAKERGE